MRESRRAGLTNGNARPIGCCARPTGVAARSLWDNVWCFKHNKTQLRDEKRADYSWERFRMNCENTHFSPRAGGSPLCRVRRFA